MMALLAWQETLNVGAIAVVIFGMALALLFTLRSRSSATWKDNYEAAEARNKDLKDELEREREKKHQAMSEIAALNLTKDITPVLEAMQTVMARIVEMQEENEYRYSGALREVRGMFADHEQKAQDRHDAQLEVLSTIAEKLNGMKGRS